MNLAALSIAFLARLDRLKSLREVYLMWSNHINTLKLPWPTLSRRYENFEDNEEFKAKQFKLVVCLLPMNIYFSNVFHNIVFEERY